MKKRHLLPLGLLGIASVALAADWSEFDSAFEALPCPDGWAGCIIGGQPVNPGMVTDSAKRPHPADMRVGFFDLLPLPGFSPFVSLSNYTEAADPVAVADPPLVPTPVKADPPPARLIAQVDNPDPRPAPTDFINRPDPVEEPDSRPDPIPKEPEVIAANTPPEPDPIPDPLKSDPVVVEVEPPPEVQPANTTPDSEPIAMTPPPEVTLSPVVADNGCDDLVSLEAPAMMGNLGVGRRKCLESRISGSSQTTKNKISRVLISDAEARGDRSDWERLMKRHLEDIDRSDPNLCFTYAIHLSRGGVGRAHGVIRWADYALENKQQWSGSTYKKNVYGLYKLRAKAANKLWQASETKYVEDRSDENESKAKKYRDLTKNYGREWLDYARASSQSTKSPLSLCVSAAGSTEFCEG